MTDREYIREFCRTVKGGFDKWPDTDKMQLSKGEAQRIARLFGELQVLIDCGDEIPLSVPTTVLRRLPLGRFIKIEEVQDMDGKPTRAILWSWIERSGFVGERRAHFDLKTGAYIGEG